MADLNVVVLDGTIVDEPELRYSPSRNGAPPTPSLHFTLAVNRPVSKDSPGQKSDYIHVISWGKRALTASQGVQKLARVAIVGFMQSRNYEKTSEVTDEQYAQLLDVLAEHRVDMVEELATAILATLGLDGRTKTEHVTYEVCALNIEFREGCRRPGEDMGKNPDLE